MNGRAAWRATRMIWPAALILFIVSAVLPVQIAINNVVIDAACAAHRHASEQEPCDQIPPLDRPARADDQRMGVPGLHQLATFSLQDRSWTAAAMATAVRFMSSTSTVIEGPRPQTLNRP